MINLRYRYFCAYFIFYSPNSDHTKSQALWLLDFGTIFQFYSLHWLPNHYFCGYEFWHHFHISIALSLGGLSYDYLLLGWIQLILFTPNYQQVYTDLLCYSRRVIISHLIPTFISVGFTRMLFLCTRYQSSTGFTKRAVFGWVQVDLFWYQLIHLCTKH